MLRYLLDTNVVIYAIKNRPQSLRQKFSRSQGQTAISSVTWGELIYGVERSAQPERNLADIESLGTRLEVDSVGDQQEVSDRIDRPLQTAWA